MIKVILKSLYLTFFIFSLCYSDTIDDIKINGNKRISKETIIVLGDFNIGSKFDDSNLNSSLKKLYDTNFFKDIELSFKNNSLVINLVENPIIEKINITGIKKKSFMEIIYDEISLKDRMSYTDFQFKKKRRLLLRQVSSFGSNVLWAQRDARFGCRRALEPRGLVGRLVDR